MKDQSAELAQALGCEIWFRKRGLAAYRRAPEDPGRRSLGRVWRRRERTLGGGSRRPRMLFSHQGPEMRGDPLLLLRSWHEPMTGTAERSATVRPAGSFAPVSRGADPSGAAAMEPRLCTFANSVAYRDVARLY